MTASLRMDADMGSMYRSDTRFPNGRILMRSPSRDTIFSSSRKSTTFPTTLSMPKSWDTVPKNVSLRNDTMDSSESASPVATRPRMWLLRTLSLNSLDVSLSVSCST